MLIYGISDKILINEAVIDSVKWPYEFDFGESIVYEVIRVIEGKPLFLREHIDRIVNSLKLLGTLPENTYERVFNAVSVFLKNLSIRNNNIKILIGNIREDGFDIGIFYIKSFYPGEEMYQKGVNTRTFSFTRSNPNAKILNEEMTAKVNQIREEEGVFEVLLVDGNGVVTEGSRSNIFFVKDSSIILSNSEKILNGITMMKVVETMKAISLNLLERDVNEIELKDFDGCFMTGTSNNILPIRSINDLKYDSSNNKVIRMLMEEFNKRIGEDLEQCQI